ncbi:MAG: hypothetical protein H8E03_00690 [Pelagibacteraceae bacterium]|nr:hypothetical protein [Pelagibacteraceae bacterium]
MSLKAIENIMSGYSPATERRLETEKLVQKWEATGLLEGLEGESKTHNMAQLLENQAKQLIDETSRVGGGGTEEWSGVALPLVRRIFGELAAQDFVSVQPMNLPSGLIFYLDFKYGTAQTAAHTVGSDIHGDTSASNADASGGLYGAGKFGYSVNDSATGTLLLSGDGTTSATTFVTASSVSWSDVEFEQDLSASVSAGTLYKVTVATSAFTNPDNSGVRAFELSGSAVTAYYPAHTKYSASASTYSFIATGTFAGAGIGVKYHKQPTDTTRGDFEDTSTSGDSTVAAGIPEVDIQMRNVSIVAKTRKLKAVWTPELAQDLNAYHSVDAEAELTAMLSEYISMEIDLEILDMLLINESAKVERWSARVGYEYDSATSLFSESSGNSNAYTKGDWFQTLGNKIQSVSNAIHQKTLRGGANFMVISPETATIIESIPGYVADTDGNASNNAYAMGVQKVGMLNSRFTVYKNPYMIENQILVGFRGSNFLETGAVYAPYVPLIMTPLVYDPTNFTPRKGVMTRYAKKMVRPEFYGKVIVADVGFV